MRFNIPSSEASKLFDTSEESKKFEKILEDVDGEKLSIFKDLEKLEDVFISLNIGKIKKKEFRESLLKYAFGNNKFKKYCSMINEIINNNDTEINKKKFIKKISNFQWGDNIQTRAFVESFELDESLILKKQIIYENIELIQKPDSIYYPMFFYQSEVHHKAKKILEHPSGRIIIQLPTGAGKTKVAMEIICDFLNKHQKSTVVWLAESAELLEQAIDEFKKNWKHRGKSEISINRAWDKYEIIENETNPKFIVGGLGKMISFFKKGGKLKADFIIFDEAHHASAEKYSEVLLNLVDSGRTRVLGLTATPGRINPKETEELAKLFNDNIPISIETHNEYESPIKFLQNQGVLSILKTGGDKIIKIPKLDLIFTEKELQKLAKTSEYNDKEFLKKIGQSHLRNVIIFRKLLRLMEEGKQIIYFGASLEQTKLMYVLLNTFNQKVGFIDGSTDTGYRKELIKKFQNKEINCLLNFAVLIAGFDAPAIDTVFIARPTKSATTLFQMIGRGMRGPNVQGGTKNCEVYHVQDKFLERFQNFEKLYETYESYYQSEELQYIHESEEKEPEISKSER